MITLPFLSFRAKKIVRSRTIFTVEEPAFHRRRRASFYVAGCAILIGSFIALSNAQSATADSDVQKQFSNITTALQNRKVASIEILHMPDGVMTRASVSPANLERWFEIPCRNSQSR
jgi:hypothetical protein